MTWREFFIYLLPLIPALVLIEVLIVAIIMAAFAAVGYAIALGSRSCRWFGRWLCRTIVKMRTGTLPTVHPNT